MKISSDPINNVENLIAKNKTKSISIYSTVMFTLILILSLLPFIKIDVTSQSRGIVRANKENVIISTIVSGKIVFIDMVKNQSVKKGDTLLRVTRENLQSEKAFNDSLYNTTQFFFDDFHQLTTGQYSMLKTSKGKGEYRAFLAKNNELKSKVHVADLNFKRQEKLFLKQVISKSEYESYEYELKNAQQVLISYSSSKKVEWEIQKQELAERLKNLKNKLNNIKIEGYNYTLIAPISGTLEGVLGLEIGSFINASQILSTISPDSEIIVENTVSPTNIGLIREGQTVKFFFDAFNYNQWGIIEGKVIGIDKNITVENNKTFFKIRCNLNSKELKLKNGYRAPISKGMTLTTQYIISQRSLFDLLFDKVEDWLNPRMIQESN